MIKFYKLKSHFFEVDKIFSFNIYLYDPMREKRVVALYAVSPVSEELKNEWQQLEDKGAYLQLDQKDKKEFHFETLITEEELNQVNEFYFRMTTLQNDRLRKYEAQSNDTFLLRAVLNEIGKTQNYLPLIWRVRAEILCFPLYESESISICTELVEKLFIRDIMPVRVAALSYMLAKQNKITDIQVLCDIVLAALLKDLGHGLIKTSLFNHFKDIKAVDIYLKHPMLSIYVLSKCGYEFSKQIKRLK